MDARKSEIGQVMVLICLAIVTIMGLIGLVADVGSLQAQRQLMQTAADSAALAAARNPATAIALLLVRLMPPGTASPMA